MRGNNLNKAVNSWAILSLIFLVLAAIFYSYINLLDNDNPRYKLEWNNSRWITTENPSASGYFRDSFNIESISEKAVLQLAATDAYEVYFNGEYLDKKEQKSMLANGVYDLSHLIQPGKNVLAVAVSRKSYPDRAGLRYELTVIDGLGRVSRFLSEGRGEIAESKLPSVAGMNRHWYESMIDDALWTKAVTWVGPSDVSHVSFNPDILLALPILEMKTLDGMGGWRVAAEKEFNYDKNDFDHAWLGFASDVPYEVILNNKSLGIFSAEDNAIPLLSIRSGLLPGLNKLSVEIMTGAAMAKFAGGIILEGSSRLSYIPFDNNWVFVSLQENIVDNDLNASDSVAQNKYALIGDVSGKDIIPFIIRDDFSLPRFFQLSPFLDGLKFFAAFIVLYLVFALWGLTIAKLINASFLPNLLTLNVMILSWFIAHDIRFDAKAFFSSYSINILLFFWIFLVFAQLLECLMLGRQQMATEKKQYANG